MTTIQRTGFLPVRRFLTIAGAAAVLAAAPVVIPAPAHAAASAASTGTGESGTKRERLSWFADRETDAAADAMLGLLRTASIDGLDPAAYDVAAIERAIEQGRHGKKSALNKADRLLTDAFVAYARDLRKNLGEGLRYFDPALKADPPTAAELLDRASAAPSLLTFVLNMGWMNPAYAPLRRAISENRYSTPRQRELLRLNLARARVLPVGLDRHVVVNAAAQKLHVYENGRLVDTMNVVVGKPTDKDQTPMMASVLQTASLNPYWNVPPDLAAERIAPNVLKYGLGYLKRHGYQVLSDWSDEATVIDPATVDWKAVADQTSEVRVRQVPGPGNALGKVKYSFRNPFAVYLHDTPDKKLLSEESRLFSGGCIRLEDSARFGEWLFRRRLEAKSDAPDIEMELDRSVPIYVTYMTAVPEGREIAFLDDVYGWDEQRLAQAGAAATGLAN